MTVRERAQLKENSGVPRRRFLGAACAWPVVVPEAVLGGGGTLAPSERLAVAAVGIGGMGQHYLRGCGDTIEVVALCDVDFSYAAPVFARYRRARRYQDFRRMLDSEEKHCEAVIVATPDHNHAVVLMEALRRKKHIYCAKPVAHTIGEIAALQEALRKAPGLVTKTSVQSSATEKARRTQELLRSGILGAIRELHVWCDHPRYPCHVKRPREGQPVPSGLNWDLWLGPAPERPYHRAYHPGTWRPWWDFGTGTVGDMACHTFHVYFEELKLAAPKVISSRSSHAFSGFFRNEILAPECQSYANMVTWQYPARSGLPPLTVTWYDGGMKPPRPPGLPSELRLPSSGLVFVGEKGSMVAGFSGGNPYSRGGLSGGLLLPERKFRDAQEPPRVLKRCERGYHYREWVAASKSGKNTLCPLQFGCAMTEVALLGTLSLRTGEVLLWDAEKRRVLNSATAQRFVDPPYRGGWSL